MVVTWVLHLGFEVEEVELFSFVLSRDLQLMVVFGKIELIF